MGVVALSGAMRRFDASFVERYRRRRALEDFAAAADAGSGASLRATSRQGESGGGALVQPPAKVRVLGVDTSLRCTGLAIVDSVGSDVRFVDARPIPNGPRKSIPECLVSIADTLERYIEEFRPDEVAMEGIFFCKNPRTALVLGHARGVVVLGCARHGLVPSEYPPTRVKRAVTGGGSATKDQMQRMMQRMFGLPDLPQEDAADALAIAVTHCHDRRIAAMASNYGGIR